MFGKIKDVCALTREFFTFRSVLPTFEKIRTGDLPVCYYDAGSAGDPPLPYRLLMRSGHLRVIGFDPGDENWLKGQGRLNKMLRIPEIDNYKYALGDKSEDACLHVTRHPGCSSLLVPNYSILEKYSCREQFDVMRNEKVRTERLDKIIADLKLPKPDILKIDTQGYEGKILEGMGDMLSDVLAVQLEVHFKPIYRGQHDFCSIHKMMTLNGFSLLDLKRQSPFGSDWVEADAFYSRDVRSERETLILSAWSEIHKLDCGINYEDIRSNNERFFLKDIA